MKKLILGAAATLTALLAQPALAATNLSGTLTFNNGTAFVQGSHTSQQGTGSFTDTFTFTLPAIYYLTTGDISTNAVKVGLTLTKDIDFSRIFIVSDTTNIEYDFTASGSNNDQFETFNLSDTGLAAGNYRLILQGNVDAAPASYSGSLNISAVPEPETWALMLFGFGAVGYSLRQKKTLRLVQAV